MKLLEDLGTHYRTNKSTIKIRYGLYECPYCKKHFKAATPDVKINRIKSCGCMKKMKPLPKIMNGFKVIKDLGIIKLHRQAIFICKECNREFTTRVANIKTGKSQSCGCLPKNKKHGLYKTRLYKIWNGMKSRCYNKGRRDQKYYYDKNIKICNEWLNHNTKFFKWAIDNGYNDSLTIDRIDPDKDYSPDNCTFVSYHKQATNKNKLMKTNTTGYKGITYLKRTNNYVARIMIHGKRICLGYFTNKEDAAEAYDNYIIDNNLIEYITNKELKKCITNTQQIMEVD